MKYFGHIAEPAPAEAATVETACKVQLPDDGAQRHPAAISEEELSAIMRLSEIAPSGTSYIALFGCRTLDHLLGPHSGAGRLIHAILGRTARPVRAILFDKTPAVNWAVGWHQDRTIAVRAR